MYTNDSTAAVIGIGIITPEVRAISDLANACSSAEKTIPQKIESIPPPQGMNSRDLRRMARLTHLALYTADKAAEQAGVKGENGSLYVGLTHGSTSLLKEFHDFLFKYGPQMASPNAFSNGVTNAPLGAVSKHLGLTHGGGTLVGYETCGMEILHYAAESLDHNTANLCFAGATEEYSPIIEDTYAQCNWYKGTAPAHLPEPVEEKDTSTGFPLSEASVFFTMCLKEYTQKLNVKKHCLFTPIDLIDDFSQGVDLIISGAGGGPQDTFELEALSALLSRQKESTGVLFSKCFFGETSAVGPLLSSALAWDILLNRTVYPVFPLHPALKQYNTAIPDAANVKTILVMSASRNNEISAGLFTLP